MRWENGRQTLENYNYTFELFACMQSNPMTVFFSSNGNILFFSFDFCLLYHFWCDWLILQWKLGESAFFFHLIKRIDQRLIFIWTFIEIDRVLHIQSINIVLDIVRMNIDSIFHQLRQFYRHFNCSNLWLDFVVTKKKKNN